MSAVSVSLQKVTRTFVEGGRELAILRGIDLEVNSGERVAIVGQSGSGKSTLLALLALLDSPSAGLIEVLGQDIGALAARERSRFRAKHIGIVFQQFHLLPHLTALENVELPLDILGLPKARARELLEELGLGDRLGHFPRLLSGGECQRVAIARALATNPALILADEPSGNLDPETGERFTQVFFRELERRGSTVILVTHNLELAKRCGRIFKLEQGRLVDQ